MSDAAREFRKGVLTIAPVMVAMIPIGLLWGTLAAGKGLTLIESSLMSVLVFAGAAQFVALDLWHQPLPVQMLIFTTFIVNIRHVLMSASISRHIERINQRLDPIIAYFLVDEVWALAEARALQKPVTFSYYMGLGLPLWAGWQLATLMGAWLGKGLGNPAALGMDFAFSALFIGILMGFWKGARTGAVLIIAAASAAVAKLYIAGAWYIVIGGVAGAITAAILHAEQEEQPAPGPQP